MTKLEMKKEVLDEIEYLGTLSKLFINEQIELNDDMISALKTTFSVIESRYNVYKEIK